MERENGSRKPCAWIAGLALCGPGGPSAGGNPAPETPRRVVLEVVAPALRHESWPRPCGVAVGRGLLRPGERLALFSTAGAERPARVEPWASASDGSPRLVRIEFDELPRDVRRLELRATHLAPPPPRLRCVRDRSSLRLHGSADDGAIEWRERTLVVSAGAARLELALGALGLADDGDERRPGRCGPLRLVGPDGAGAGLALSLHFDESADDRAAVPVEARLALASSARIAELELVLTAPRDLLVRSLHLRGRIAGAGPALRRGEVAVAPDRRGDCVAAASGVPGVIAPEEPAEAVAPLVLVAGHGRERVELTWSDFGLARPSRARLRRDGSFELALVAEPLLLHHGQMLRRTLALARGDRVGRAQERPFVLERGEFALDDATRAWLAPWREWITGWLGRPRRIDDRGCYPEPWGALANGEYDLGGSLLWLGAVERDAAWLAAGAAIARHTLEWDRGAPAEAPAGLFFQHGDDHASGKVEAGHQWSGGLVGLARACGSLAALDGARRLVGALAEWQAQPARFAGPERRLAWPLQVAVELHETAGEVGARELGRALLRAVAARQAEAGYLDGDRRPTRDGARTWVNAWVSLGATVPALVRAERAIPGEGALESAGRLARFVVDAALVPDGLAEVVLVDPEFGVAAATQGRCRGGSAALAGAGVGWLARGGGEATLLALAGALREQARVDLAAPRADRLAELAKALLALRFEAEAAAAAPARAQSLSSPSSLRESRPREKR